MKRFLPLQISAEKFAILIAGMLLMTLSFSAFAQTKAITGTVTGGTAKEPQPGVSIYEKGSSNGTITDADGNYSITVAEGATLVFSSIGFITQEVKVGEQTSVTITLKDDSKTLDEVVVVGYGEQKRSNVTGAVASVTVEDMTNKTQLRLDQALQGLVAGVTVARDGGAPGSAPSIHIRGAGSIYNTEPLWIVDGIQMDPGNQFEIDDVESMEILKDASAAAIYGAKAAHGVILVTTKRGKGPALVTFKSSISKRSPVKLPNLLRSEEFIYYRKQGRENAGQNPDPSWDNYEHDTDWLDAFYNGSGILQQYDLSVAKGDEKMNFFLSFGHDNEQGILIDNSFKRYSMRVNSDVKLSSWFKIGESALLSRVSENPIGNNDENRSGSIPYRSIPIMPIRDASNPFGGWGMGPAYFNGPNPVATQYQQHEEKTYNRFDGNVYLEATPIKGFMVRGTLGLNFMSFLGKKFEESFDYGTFSDPINRLYYTSANNQTIVANVVATYGKTIAKHSIKVMAGYESFQYDPKTFNVAGSQFVVDVADSYALSSGPASVPDKFMPGQVRTLSQFGRINYNYDERYLLEANIRRDGSSKFGPNNRWGVFPSVSAGWRMSEEKFYEYIPILSKVVNSLKFRVSTGRLGSDKPLDNFLYIKTYTSQFSTYAFDEKGLDKVRGFFLSKFPNEDIKWEDIYVHNFAFDATALNNRLSFTFEYYIRNTKDMLYPVTPPPSLGIAVHNFSPVAPFLNVGEMRNTGIDLELGYKQSVGVFNFNASGNVSFLKNELKRLYSGSDYIAGGGAGQQIGGMARTQAGYPISSFYGYVVQQMLNSDADVYAINTYASDGFYQESGTGPGDFMYKDLNPTKANSEITADADRTFIGNPWPKMTYGLNLSVAYKNMIDLSIQFQGVAGVDIFNASLAYTRNFFGDNNTTTLIRQAWTEGKHTGNPRNIAIDHNANWSRPSTYFVEDGSYLKLRNIQLGFNLPTDMLTKLKLKKLRVYTNINNFLTFTKYSGLDPEVAGGNTSRGIDYGQYPQVRTFTAGLEVQF